MLFCNKPNNRILVVSRSEKGQKKTCTTTEPSKIWEFSVRDILQKNEPGASYLSYGSSATNTAWAQSSSYFYSISLEVSSLVLIENRRRAGTVSLVEPCLVTFGSWEKCFTAHPSIWLILSDSCNAFPTFNSPGPDTEPQYSWQLILTTCTRKLETVYRFSLLVSALKVQKTRQKRLLNLFQTFSLTARDYRLFLAEQQKYLFARSL